MIMYEFLQCFALSLEHKECQKRLLNTDHLPVASGAPLTRLPRDRGNGGSRSREGSRPAQRWSSGTELRIQ